MADLTPAVTVYAAPDVDRDQLARLIDAMARLNGVIVAIELHESMPNPRCYGCGERITQDEQGHWSADDGAGGWFYMCAAMGHQDEHAPASNPRGADFKARPQNLDSVALNPSPRDNPSGEALDGSGPGETRKADRPTLDGPGPSNHPRTNDPRSQSFGSDSTVDQPHKNPRTAASNG